MIPAFSDKITVFFNELSLKAEKCVCVPIKCNNLMVLSSGIEGHMGANLQYQSLILITHIVIKKKKKKKKLLKSLLWWPICKK